MEAEPFTRHFRDRQSAFDYLARHGWIHDVKERWYLPSRIRRVEFVRLGTLLHTGSGLALDVGPPLLRSEVP